MDGNQKLFLLNFPAGWRIIPAWSQKGFGGWEETPMQDPGRVSFQIRLAAFGGALAASHSMTANCLKLLSWQQRMLTGGPHRRMADGRNCRHEPQCQGADLTSKYGFRHHDVDVERL